jgi:hypothetical protein
MFKCFPINSASHTLQTLICKLSDSLSTLLHKHGHEDTKDKTDTYDSQLHLPVPTLYSSKIYGLGRRRDMIATKGKSEPRIMNLHFFKLACQTDTD